VRSSCLCFCRPPQAEILRPPGACRVPPAVPDPHNRRSALALSDAGGHSRVAWVGLASAIVGQLIITAAEVIWQSNRDLGNVLFSVSPILTGAGLVTAGVAIIRAGVWARPSRFLPLTLGLYTILVLIPVMIASGGPPAPLALWTIGAGTCCGSCSAPASCASPQRCSERPGNGRDHRSYLTAHPLIGMCRCQPSQHFVTPRSERIAACADVRRCPRLRSSTRSAHRRSAELQVPSVRELAGDSPLLPSGSPRQVQQRSSQRRFRSHRVAPPSPGST
jgi:hypothetical protein